MVAFTVIVLVVLVICSQAVVIIPSRHTGVLERLGKFHRVLKPGPHVIIPFFDSVAYRHEMREQVLEVPPQNCITKDNIQVEVDGVIYLKVWDTEKASYGIGNYRVAAVNLAQTTMRSEIGKLTLHQSFSERESLNQTVVEEIDKASDSWGVKVLRYEIMNIGPSSEVVHTLEKAMEAERERRAEVTLATAEKEAMSAVSEGKRQEAINISEGEKQKRINEAEGKAKQIEVLAEATAFGVRKIAEAISQPSGNEAVRTRIVQQYIDEFGGIVESSELTIVPEQLANIKGVFEGLERVIGPVKG